MFFGCTVLDKHYKYSTTLDLSKYSNNGILITTGDLHTTYKPIGIITSVCKNGYKLKPGKKETSNKYIDDVYSNQKTYDNPLKYEYYECTISDAIDYLYKQAKVKGANGLIKLKLDYKIDQTGKIYITTAQALAIKY